VVADDTRAESVIPPPLFHHRTSFPVRVARFARVSAHVAGGLATTVFVFPWIASHRKQAIIQLWCRRLLGMLGVETSVQWRHDGGFPPNVLIVANHISWLDIFVLNALKPARFVAKAEVRRWPVLGRLSANVGTLFIERERRRGTHIVNAHTVEALARGDLVAVFPEGTTSDGRGLLKFHSSLLQPIVDAKGHVQPIAIRYRTPTDEHSDVPALVGSLSLVGSCWQVTGERKLIAEVHLMRSLPASAGHRRELSRAAEAAIRSALESPGVAPALETRGDHPA
jgi:1-acyl-sn-glycerol-3-phosphate acyltransferase